MRRNPRPKMIVLQDANPHMHLVKAKSPDRLVVYQVKSRNKKQALQRYLDPSFSKCVLSLAYRF